jgi:uncharacterized protein YegL
MQRRLPVYLLLDGSESMIGGPLRSVEEGVRLMIRELKRNPYALETLHMGIISFAARAEEALPLTELALVSAPSLSPRPGTGLGAALRLVREAIDRDVAVTTSERKGDFRPIVFVLTDGEPTDEWREAAAALRGRKPRPQVVAMGCGDEADLDVLRELAGGAAVHVRDLSPESVGEMFSWVSASIGVSSRAADATTSGAPGGGVILDKAPLGKGLSLVKDGDMAPARSPARLFIHVRCPETDGNWLAIYRAGSGDRTYDAHEAHRLPEGFYRDGEASGAPAEEVALRGSPGCPYCGATQIYFCSYCFKAYCFKPGATSFYCPTCRETYGVFYGERLKAPTSQG